MIHVSSEALPAPTSSSTPQSPASAAASFRWESTVGYRSQRSGATQSSKPSPAALCHQLAAAGEAQPGLQVLIYPATDLRRLTASYRSLAQGYLLTAEDIAWFLEQVQPPDVSAPAVSPLLAPDLTGLAPAVVATAGFDPLRDEGEAYARRLGDAALGRLLDAVRVGGEWGRDW